MQDNKKITHFSLVALFQRALPWCVVNRLLLITHNMGRLHPKITP